MNAIMIENVHRIANRVLIDNQLFAELKSALKNVPALQRYSNYGRGHTEKFMTISLTPVQWLRVLCCCSTRNCHSVQSNLPNAILILVIEIRQLFESFSSVTGNFHSFLIRFRTSIDVSNSNELAQEKCFIVGICVRCFAAFRYFYLSFRIVHLFSYLLKCDFRHFKNMFNLIKCM